MAINEKVLNGYIARAMEQQSPPGYAVKPEGHGQARSGTTSPDLVVFMPYGLRTIIETEYGAPAVGDAKDRLGYEFNDSNIPMKSVLAVGIPRGLGELSLSSIETELGSDKPLFELQVVTGKSEDDPSLTVMPEKPVSVSLSDLLQYAWLAAIPAAYSAVIIDEVVSDLSVAKTALQARLEEFADEVQNRLIDRYGNHDSANRMESVAGNAVGTLAAMVQLHMNLKEWGNADDVLDIRNPTLWQSVEPHNGLPDRMAREWRKIEQVDYMPLSTIAAGMLEDSDLAARLGATLKAVKDSMSEYVNAGISATTNVVAEIWQALIPDRDERAAYYTKPPVAEFLGNITTRRLQNPAETRYVEVCAGTGTLARATEENIRFRHYANSADKGSIHAERMERFIQLTDINPQSVSVATANMSSLEPQTAFADSAIFAITRQGGSLNFLTPEGVADMEQGLVGSYGAQGANRTLEPRTAGICCNNDPYLRAKIGSSNPIDSKAMGRYRRDANKRVKGVADGQAGLATFMHVIEHQWLESGAPHGKVLPLTAAHAKSYQGFRRNFEREYSGVIAISTASGDGDSMSADTDIQEMLLVGTKESQHLGSVSLSSQDPDDDGEEAIVQTDWRTIGHVQAPYLKNVMCVNLQRTFTNRLEAKMFADAIRREAELGKPHGDIIVGTSVGTYHRMVGPSDGQPWSSLGISGDYTLLTDHVTQGRAWDPATGATTEFGLPMTTLT